MNVFIFLNLFVPNQEVSLFCFPEHMQKYYTVQAIQGMVC